MQFGAKIVTVGNNTKISLIPHLGEFDEAALFTKTLDYETPVFEWLAANAPTKYDLIIEIGANVGIYTVFLDSLTKLPGSKLAKIIAFEPSPEAFRRLLENLDVNKAQHVLAVQAAIAPKSGVETFFEPAGHLTNGSFVREFAALFSKSITETEVVAIGVGELEKYLDDARKALIKIDVEGFEPVLVGSLGSAIEKYHPDLLIEVFDATAEQLEQMSTLRRYRKFLITSDGLLESQHLFACSRFRDWLLFSELTIPARLAISDTLSAASQI
jgi:FkbM family methyltransferase